MTATTEGAASGPAAPQELAGMSGQLLDRSCRCTAHRETRAERVTQRMCTARRKVGPVLRGRGRGEEADQAIGGPVARDDLAPFQEARTAGAIPASNAAIASFEGPSRNWYA